MSCRTRRFNFNSQGRSQDFSKGGGGHTVSNMIVMAFSSRNIIGCFLKKKAYKEGGVTGTTGPPPRYALDSICRLLSATFVGCSMILSCTRFAAQLKCKKQLNN